MERTTIGFIDHNPSVHSMFLGPSIDGLEGDFDVISIKSSEGYPAEIYNRIIDESKNDIIVLTHQDVSFSSDFLERIYSVFEVVDDWGALGIVGVDNKGRYWWGKDENCFELNTLDCCLIVIKKSHEIRFDSYNFDEFHLYVEDYCCRLRANGYRVFTIPIDSKEANNDVPHYSEKFKDKSFAMHHSVTVRERGTSWGRYKEYKGRLINLWPDAKTT